jgi:hypothetical protein
MGGSWQRWFGIACLVAAAWATQRSWEIHRDGVVVEGKVIRVDAKVAVDDRSISYTERAVVTYRRREGGDLHTLKGHWSSPLFGAHQPGDKVMVRYLPDETDDAQEDSMLVNWVLPVVLLVLGISGLAGGLRSSGNEWVIWRSGND